MTFAMTAGRYARALYEVAVGAGGLPAVIADMKTVRRILEQLPEVRSFCSGRAVDPADAKQVVEIAFAPYVGALVTRTLQQMALNGRMASLPLLPDAFGAVRDAADNTVNAVIEFAHAPAKGVAERIAARMGEKTGHIFRVETKINPSLLGGFIITWPGRMLDTSALRRSRQLSRSLRTGRA